MVHSMQVLSLVKPYILVPSTVTGLWNVGEITEVDVQVHPPDNSKESNLDGHMGVP